jgi:acyl dehydratase
MAERELRNSPSMTSLFVRAGVAMIPGASRLPFVGGGGGETIPDLSLAISDVAIDRDRLAAYDRVCGFALSDRLAPTYPHMLAFPLDLALMTDGRFPFPVIGLVHIANRIVQHRPLDARERLSLRVSADPVTPHPRGRQFAIRTQVRVNDELVWEEVSTNLRRGAGSSAEGGDGEGDRGTEPNAGKLPASAAPAARLLPASATWRLPGDLGRRYGSVSGDLNPIHVHRISARLFGFKSAIAHGMWTKARCLAALGPRLPDAFGVEVSFKRPILLPATVHFGQARLEQGIRFGVRDAERGTPHLDGLVRFDG